MPPPVSDTPHAFVPIGVVNPEGRYGPRIGDLRGTAEDFRVQAWRQIGRRLGISESGLRGWMTQAGVLPNLYWYW